MKKSYFCLGAILFVMAVLLLGAAAATAAEKTEFQCIETFKQPVEAGSVSYPDGNIHIRGMVALYREVSNDARYIGDNTVVLNANLRADGTQPFGGSGPVWGTFHFETDEGGLWEGTWNGIVSERGFWYHAVGDGVGMYAGMKLWVESTSGDCQARILDHGH